MNVPINYNLYNVKFNRLRYVIIIDPSNAFLGNPDSGLGERERDPFTHKVGGIRGQLSIPATAPPPRKSFAPLLPFPYGKIRVLVHDFRRKRESRSLARELNSFPSTASLLIWSQDPRTCNSRFISCCFRYHLWILRWVDPVSTWIQSYYYSRWCNSYFVSRA